MTDMPVKNLAEFKQYLEKYEGPTKRFIKPQIKYSNDVRLSMCRADDIVRYLLNYSLRDTTYSEEYHNCQSFAADLFGFLCAKPNVEPFYPIKFLHNERRHL